MLVEQKQPLLEWRRGLQAFSVPWEDGDGATSIARGFGMMGIAMVMGAAHHCLLPIWLPLVLTWGLERTLGY